MRQEHKDVFFDAAQKFTCWIGLREPNLLADKWIGRGGFTPKIEACKAKTSDNPAYQFAGLVVDPTVCPQAFKPATLRGAVDTWNSKFLSGGRLPAGFTIVESGLEKGLVKYHGAAIYADFDLMSIVKSNDKAEFLPTTNAEERQLFQSVEPVLNQGFHAKMIQHGAEFMWTGGLGARESECIFWFGPNRKFSTSYSSMPRKGH